MRLRLAAALAAGFVAAAYGCGLSTEGMGAADPADGGRDATTTALGEVDAGGNAGGDDATVPGNDGNGGTDAPVTPGEAGPADAGDAGRDAARDADAAAPVVDAAPDVTTVVDAGRDAPDPSTVVPCGSAGDCVIATHFCCFENNGASCVANGGQCSDISVECNDTRDCFGNTICCYDNGNKQAECRGGATCGTGRVRLCDPDLPDQCPLLSNCVRVDGGRGYGTCQ